MAIKTYGVPDSIGAAEWSRLLQDLGDAGRGCAVPTGFAASVSGSNVVLTAGRSLQAGTLAVSDASATVPVTNNAAAAARIDLLCLQVDWTGNTDTAGTLVTVKGTPAASPVAPALTQTPGVLWQTPLARFRVAAGASVASSLTDARPQRAERTCSGTVSLVNGETKTLLFPVGFYTLPPRVTLTPTTGAGTTTEVNYWTSNKSAASFDASMNRSTSTSTNFEWIASGV